MEYKPAEIAEELGARKEQIIRLISVGAPARKDSKGHYWIHGKTFVQWLKDAGPKKPGDRATIEEDECYCVKCRQVVHYIERRRIKRIVYGTCPKGHKTSRFVKLEKGKR